MPNCSLMSLILFFCPKVIHRLLVHCSLFYHVRINVIIILKSSPKIRVNYYREISSLLYSFPSCFSLHFFPIFSFHFYILSNLIYFLGLFPPFSYVSSLISQFSQTNDLCSQVFTERFVLRIIVTIFNTRVNKGNLF
jgi:hypothetical protein